MKVAQSPSSIGAGEMKPRYLSVYDIAVKFQRGDVFGQRAVDASCLSPEPLLWGTSSDTVFGDELRASIESALHGAGLPLVGRGDAIAAASTRSGFAVLATLESVQLSLCMPEVAAPAGALEADSAATLPTEPSDASFSTDLTSAAPHSATTAVTEPHTAPSTVAATLKPEVPLPQSHARVAVAWQLYSHSEKRVVLQKTTASDLRFLAATEKDHLLHAFADAAVQFAADPALRELVFPKPVLVAAGSRIQLPYVAPLSGSIAANGERIQGAVVTIIAGGRHGSGFFVSGEGLLVTNEHVVLSDKSVCVRLTDGNEVIGEVLRSNKDRDVALVRVFDRFPVLPIRDALPSLGEDVYALGTPLEERFSATLTKGIVSGIRNDEGKRFIQSDTPIFPGSSGGPLIDTSGAVVGMTAVGRVMNGVPTALNFFIPIADVFAALNLERAAP